MANSSKSAIETNEISYHGYKPGGTLLPPIIRGVMKNPSLRSSDWSAAWEAATVPPITAKKRFSNALILGEMRCKWILVMC